MNSSTDGKICIIDFVSDNYHKAIMKHIVLAWEMGGGFGHLDRLKALAVQLLSYGYKVTLVACHLDRAKALFADVPVDCLQAPQGCPPAVSLSQTPAYVHVLFNAGYGSQHSLTPLVTDWYQLLCSLQPDMLVADHAPTALLVSRDMNIIRVNYGDGFTCPQPSAPLPFLSKTAIYDQVIEDEKEVLGYCNISLQENRLSLITFLGEIYKVDETFLLTVPELDHLGRRYQVHYCGALSANPKGVQPTWSVAREWPKVFVYLQYSVEFSSVLDLLAERCVEALIYIENLPPSLQSNYQQYDHMRFSDSPVNLNEVLKYVDFVMTHGGHQVTLQAAYAGIPQLHIPLTLEQQLMTYRCSVHGSSLYGFLFEIDNQLTEMLNTLHQRKQRAVELSKVMNNYGRDPLGRCLALINFHLGKRARVKPTQTFWEETGILPEYRLPAEEL